MKKKIFLAITILAAVFFLTALWLKMSGFQEEKQDRLEPACVPSVEVEGTTYAITSVFEGSSECPEGFAYAGEIAPVKPIFASQNRENFIDSTSSLSGDFIFWVSP